MTDEDRLYLRPRTPSTYDERHPTGSELEFVMAQLARISRELARFAFMILFVGAVLGTVGIEAFWHSFPVCGSA
jgi:hypothetical protein